MAAHRNESNMNPYRAMPVGKTPRGLCSELFEYILLDILSGPRLGQLGLILNLPLCAPRLLHLYYVEVGLAGEVLDWVRSSN